MAAEPVLLGEPSHVQSEWYYVSAYYCIDEPACWLRHRHLLAAVDVNGWLVGRTSLPVSRAVGVDG